MPNDFDDLARLIETNPEAYRRAISRLRAEEPPRFAAFVEILRDALENEIEGSRRRRSSSISALAVGDVELVLKKRRPTE